MLFFMCLGRESKGHSQMEILSVQLTYLLKMQVTNSKQLMSLHYLLSPHLMSQHVKAECHIPGHFTNYRCHLNCHAEEHYPWIIYELSDLRYQHVLYDGKIVVIDTFNK